MPIPKYNQMYQPFLKAISDGKEHTLKEIKKFVALELNLTEENLNLLLPSKKQTIFNNRIGWSRTYLKKLV